MRIPFLIVGRRALLLLMLAGALAGFFLLINFLGSQTASGPDDLFAPKPSDDQFIPLPSGAEMFAFTIGAVGLVMAVVALSAPGNWRFRGRFPVPRWSLIVGALLALAAAGVGIYLATSGILSQDLAYEQHLAERQFIQPEGLAILVGFFLSLALVGIFVPRLLPIHLASWLILSLIMGLFGSSALSGLELFNRPWEMEEQVAFAAEVDKHREPREDDSLVATPGEGGERETRTEAPEGPESPLYVGPRVVAAPAPRIIAATQFLVEGARHTRLLRTATGDTYAERRWTQVDPAVISAPAGADIPAATRAMITGEGAGAVTVKTKSAGERSHGDLLVGPSAAALSSQAEHIFVYPAEEFEVLDAGIVPVPALTQQLGLGGQWQPFSGTFQTDQPATSNQTLSVVLEFAEGDLVGAAPVNDTVYLETPATLPPRIRLLSKEITDAHAGPYAKALALAQYLTAEYSHLPPTSGEAPLQPPVDVDPVDWFLFEHRAGRVSSFTSAFVILSRYAGVPSRVVSGWAIVPTADQQPVSPGQAHQWVEIALQGVGWVTFDLIPKDLTGPSAAPTGEEPAGEGAAGEGAATGATGGANEGEGPGGEPASWESAPWEPGSEEELAAALEELAEDLDPETRAAAAEALGDIGGDIGGETALAGLAAAIFEDPHPLVQEAALEAVALADFDLLVKTLLENPESLLRMAAAAGLAQRDDPDIRGRALGPLVQALTTDLDPEVRAAVAEALGELGETDALDHLARALLSGDEPDEAVRVAVAGALAALEVSGGVTPLLDALESDISPGVREAAVEALGELGFDAAAGGLAQALLEDPDAGVREAAAGVLAEFTASESLPALGQARDEDESPEVRAAAGDAIDEFSQAQLTGALEESDDPAVRATAAGVLGERGDPEIIPELAEALNDSEGQVREAAGEALESLGTMTSLESGGGLLNHSGGASLIPGTSTEAASGLTHAPIFEVEGAAGVSYLRTTVGDTYVDGQWLADRVNSVNYSADTPFAHSGFPAGEALSSGNSQTTTVTIRPAGESETIGRRVPGRIPRGVVPTSPIISQLSTSGTYHTQSMVFASGAAVEDYTWSAATISFTPEQLRLAQGSGEYPNNYMPSEVPDRVRDLAQAIVKGHDMPYARAKAIEQYLRTNYTYRLADPGATSASGGTGADAAAEGTGPGADPVDRFLFESREGTCGNFSSAFVILARAVGLPARVVSGWAITPTAEAQVVHTDQAHQWAEVAFEGLGWVTFEPTAPGGAPERAPGYSEDGGVAEQELQQEIEELVEELAEIVATGDPVAQEEARESLEGLGAEVAETESGASVVTQGGQMAGVSPGTSTAQSAGNPSVPIYLVTGSAHTSYLRTATGDVYENGRWRQLDPVSLSYDPGRSVAHLVRDEITRPSGAFSSLPQDRVQPQLLVRYGVAPPMTYTDTIKIEPAQEGGTIPPGVAPTSPYLDQVEAGGTFRPYSGTFILDEPVPSYTWVSQVPRFSPAHLAAAQFSTDATYLQLPGDLPDRIRALALEVTAGEATDYGKAKALEGYLKTNYTYAFADPSGGGRPPAGSDPVDWFLFEHQEGTCGVFSTAFAVMARSIGIPARVVSGWAIGPTPDTQTVSLDQAHQWAEVAFEGLGWVTFEPTASGGPLNRAFSSAGGIPLDGSGQGGQGQGGQGQGGQGQGGQGQGGQGQGGQGQDGQGQDGQGQGGQGQGGQGQGGQGQGGQGQGGQGQGGQGQGGQGQGGQGQGGQGQGGQGQGGQGQEPTEEPGPEVEQPEEEAEEPTPPPPPEPPKPKETVIEITQWPLEIERDFAFSIGGTVLTDSGGPVSGVQVELFINETKEHGGTLIGEAVAQNGAFQADVELSLSMDRGNYQLIAHAIGNEQYLESWSDPGISVYSRTSMELTGFNEVEVDTEAQFHGRLFDDTGAGVPDLELKVTVDDIELPPLSSGPAGDFSFAQTFVEPGPHAIEVAFEGGDLLRGNSARVDLVALLPTSLAVSPLGQVEVGESFNVEGVLQDLRGTPMPNVDVSIVVGSDPELVAGTDDEGRFEAAYSLDTAGEYTVWATFNGERPVLPSEGMALVVARHQTAMSVAGPAVIVVGEETAFHGRVESATLEDLGALPVVISDAEGAELTTVETDAGGFFKYELPSTAETGPSSFTAHFRGEEFVAPSSASVAYTIKSPTVLTVEGPTLVEPGDMVELTGSLKRADGQPVEEAPVWRSDAAGRTLTTDADGSFTLEFPAEADLGPTKVETEIEIAFGFDGNDHLSPALAVETFSVGIPWLAVEPTETVARGETATLRGYVFVGNSPQQGTPITLTGGLSGESSATGAFVLRNPIAADAGLGQTELTVAAPELEVETVAALEIKANTNLVVVPLERVRRGEEVPLQVTLYDDMGAGIAGATLTNSQGGAAVTDGTGAAMVLLAVPDTEELLAVPVTFTYAGSDSYLPLSYFVGVPVTPTSFNWLLWVVTPALLVAVAAAWFAGRMLGGSALPVPVPPALARVMPDRVETADSEEEAEEAEPPPEPVPTRLSVTIATPAPDLPAVWGPGEEIGAMVQLVSEEGAALAGQTVEIRGPGGSVASPVTDAQGSVTAAWTGEATGEYTIAAAFAGNQDYEPSTDSQGLRVVEFREEIVRLYQDFEAWATEQVAESAGKTPREVEALLVGAGVRMDHRALDEVISRFEEADYSEHSIERGHYEAMYRAWNSLSPEEVETGD